MTFREFRRFLKQLKDKAITVFLSTHILDDVERVCDRVSILNKGKILLILLSSFMKQGIVAALFVLLLNYFSPLIITVENATFWLPYAMVAAPSASQLPLEMEMFPVLPVMMLLYIIVFLSLTVMRMRRVEVV